MHLSNGSTEQVFNSSKEKEISAYDFIASQGQQTWLPTYGEECEFSDNKAFYNPSKMLFKYYRLSELNKIGEFVVRGGNQYIYCRPLPKTKTITIDGKDIEISVESFDAFKQQFCE